MEELDEDDFSDLYADVEVQASSAITAMHGLTEMPLEDDEIFGNATGGEDVEGEDGGGGNLTKLPMENGDNYHKRGDEIEVNQNKQGGVHGNEISGDSDVVIQKKRVDETASRVYEPSEDDDADLDDETGPCFSSGSDDDGPNFGRNDGGINASERGSRHTPARDPVSLDSDKYGNVQISDSEEDNLQEVSDYDSDGTVGVMKTSDDTNRRNARSISNKIPSAVKPDSFQSGNSQQGLASSCSPSPSAALSDDDIEKSRKYSEKHCEYRPSGDSKNHGVKPRTMDRRYCDRQRGPRSNHRPDLVTHLDHRDASDVKGPHDMHQSRITHGEKRVMIDSESNEKDTRRCNRSERFFTYSSGFFPNIHLNPAYLNKPYWNLNPSFGYGAGWCDGHHMNERQHFLASQMEYEAMHDAWYGYQRRHGVQDNFEESRKLIPKSYYVNRKDTQLSNKGDGMQFRRRTKGDDLSPPRDYSYEHRRPKLNSDRDRDHLDHRYDPNIPRDRREMDSHVRGKRRRDSPLNNSDSLWRMEREENDRRYIKNQPIPFYSHKEPRISSGARFQRAAESRRKGDRDRVYLDHRCDPNLPRDRREMEGPGRGKKRLDSPLNSSDNLWSMNTEGSDRRYIEHRPLRFQYHKEPCGPRRGHDDGADGPKSGVPQTHLRFSWKDINRENDWYGSNISTFDGREGLDHLVRRRHYNQSTNPFTTNENIKNHDDQDSFVRRRHLQQPEILHSDDELYKFRQEDGAVFHSEGPPYHFERILRNKRPDDRHAYDHAAELINEREVNIHRFELIREEDCNNEFEGGPKFFRPDSPVQMHPRYRESVDPRLIVVGKKQSSRRASKSVDVVHNGRYDDLMELNDTQDLKYFKDLNDFIPEKAVLANEEKEDTNPGDKKWHDKFPENQQNEFLDIEEGQIIEIDEKPLECVVASERVTQISDKKDPKTAANENRVVEGLDEKKMQEIIAKMERRRERFKDPVTLSRDSENISKHVYELDVESAEGKLERPARKRRWCGS